MNKTSLEVYLFFPGNAKEAMEFYKGVFGGELSIQLMGEVDPSAPADKKDKIMHASLSGGVINLMASDRSDTSLEPQTRISISVNGYDEPLISKIYNDLSQGGNPNHPLKKEFWGDTFGSLTDKYGINWMFNIGTDKA